MLQNYKRASEGLGSGLSYTLCILLSKFSITYRGQGKTRKQRVSHINSNWLQQGNELGNSRKIELHSKE